MSTVGGSDVGVATGPREDEEVVVELVLLTGGKAVHVDDTRPQRKLVVF